MHKTLLMFDNCSSCLDFTQVVSQRYYIVNLCFCLLHCKNLREPQRVLWIMTSSVCLCCRCSFSPCVDVGVNQRAWVSFCQSSAAHFCPPTWRFTCISKCSEASSPSPGALLSPVVSASHCTMFQRPGTSCHRQSQVQRTWSSKA